MIRTHLAHWRWRLVMLGALLPLMPAAGCCSSSNTDRGILTGGALGAVAGALAGGPRHAGIGALAGGAIGAVAGGAIGASKDDTDRKIAAARQAAARPSLSLEQIVNLTSSGMSDDVIITQINNSGSVYNLQAEHLLYLQQHGVREPVIRFMQSTVNRVPVQMVQPVYVVQPAPPIGFGVGVRIR